MLAKALVVLIISSCPALAAGATVKLNFGANGIVRIQRIESGFVMGDVFGGFLGDRFKLEPGAYRLQAIVTDGAPLEMSYFEVDVSPEGAVTPYTISPPLSSAPYRGQKAMVRHIEPLILIEGNDVEITSATDADASPRLVSLTPPMRATNWASDLSELKSIRIDIESHPSNAEIWIDGTKTSFDTDASFVIPLNGSRFASPISILVRKEGYINKLIPIGRGESHLKFRVMLTD